MRAYGGCGYYNKCITNYKIQDALHKLLCLNFILDGTKKTKD